MLAIALRGAGAPSLVLGDCGPKALAARLACWLGGEVDVRALERLCVEFAPRRTACGGVRGPDGLDYPPHAVFWLK